MGADAQKRIPSGFEFLVERDVVVAIFRQFDRRTFPVMMGYACFFDLSQGLAGLRIDSVKASKKQFFPKPKKGKRIPESVLKKIKLPPPRPKKSSAREDFQLILNPLGGEIYEEGSKIAVYWTGGPDTVQAVALILVDAGINAVADGIGPIKYSNNESLALFVWKVPTNFLNPLRSRKYRFYIEDMPRTKWQYGPIFSIHPGIPGTKRRKRGS